MPGRREDRPRVGVDVLQQQDLHRVLRRSNVRSSRWDRKWNSLVPPCGGPPPPGTAGVVAGRPVVPFRERLRLPLTILRPPERKFLHGARAVIVSKDESASTRIRRCRSARAAFRSCAREGSRGTPRGRVDRPRDVPRARHAEGRDPGGFRVPRDQSHGLVADGSDRNEQHRVDAVLQEPGGQARGQVLGNAAGGVDPPMNVWKRLESPPRKPSRTRRRSVSIGKMTFGSLRASDRS